MHTQCASKQLIFRVVHFPFLFYTLSGFSSDFPFLLSEFLCSCTFNPFHFIFFSFFGGGECDAFVIEFMRSSRACASQFYPLSRLIELYTERIFTEIIICSAMPK